MKRILFIGILTLIFSHLYAQKKWTGLAMDGLWSTAANWTGNAVPLTTDVVMLDNSFVAGNYFIKLPDDLVIIRSVTLTPAAGKQISLELPVTNTLDTAFMLTGQGYGCIINDGGIFKNASGATAGYGFVTTDSIRINNGGHYIHNTKRSNANIVRMLARTGGTEKGIFEFDVPGTTGYTPSLTGRTFGTLIFSALAAGKARSYSASGGTVVTIRGDLQILGDANISINLTKDLLINGDLVQKGGTFNIANQPNNTTVRIAGNIIQLPGAAITESSTGNPSIALVGAVPQSVSMGGAITNNINFIIDNPAGVILSAALSIPDTLVLQKGALHTSAENMLTLQPASIITVTDSVNTYIDGPVKKLGLINGNFYLPVGKTNARPLRLMQASGDFTINYINESPTVISADKMPDVKAISNKEYWEVTAGPDASGKLGLYYDAKSFAENADAHNFLSVRYQSGKWTAVGHDVEVRANKQGFVTSADIGFATSKEYFTLGSINIFDALAIKFLSFTARASGTAIALNWTIAPEENVDRFEIEKSVDDISFTVIASMSYANGITTYSYNDIKSAGESSYRIKAIEKNGDITISRLISARTADDGHTFAAYFSGHSLIIKANTQQATAMQCRLFDAKGALLVNTNIMLEKGRQEISVPLNELADGAYIVQIITPSDGEQILRIAKRH